MFEYWIFTDETAEIKAMITDHIFNGENEEYLGENGDRVWFFYAKNLFVLKSDVSFGDSNLLLDDLLIKLAKNYEIHDKGIIKSHWHASSFY
jgi:hypothetical protein